MEPDPAAQRRERPLAGLGRFTWLVGVGTALAVAIAAAGLWLVSPRGRPEPGATGPRDASGRSPPAPTVTTGPGAAPAAGPLPAAARPAGSGRAHREETPPEPSPVGSIARELERRHATGELAEAQRRFEACPGGDVRRLAWIERDQRVVKLARQRADGLLVEEWFDGEGRLREALVRGRAGGRPWARQVTLDERGRETEVGAAGGLAPEEPPPALIRRDPTGAFFAGAGCAPSAR